MTELRITKNITAI